MKNKLVLVLILLLSINKVVSQGSVVVYNSQAGISTINGTPFFPKGIYTGNGVALSLDWENIKNQGYNIIQSYHFPNLSDANILTVMNRAEIEGVYVLFMLNQNDVSGGNLNNIIAKVNKFKNHNALYGWYLIDEPDLQGISSTKVNDAYNAIKSNDANHPVFISTFDFDGYQSGADVDMHQFYEGRPDFMKTTFLNKANGNVPRIGYIDLVNSALYNKTNTSWLAIINLHSTRFNSPRGLPEDQDAGKNVSPAQFYHSSSTLTGTERSNRGFDMQLNYVAKDIVPFGKKPVFPSSGGVYTANSNFPMTTNRFRGQVTSALAYGSNAIFGWLWENDAYSNPPGLNNRWGYYTIFHHTPTKNTSKTVLSEVSQFEDMLITAKDEDVRGNILEGNLTYRYIKKGDRELIIVVNEQPDGSPLSASIASFILPDGASTSGYMQLEGSNKSPIDLSGFTIPGRSGIFFLKGNSLSINENKLSDMVLYPNPVKESFRIKGVNNAKIQVFDARGSMVLDYNQYKGTKISVNKLQSGFYFVRVVDENKSQKTIKLVIK
ncbi:T9SS type A sorting domain-containing protein [Algibacter mikhailovii]|uniref:Secretion system C-terminal sorting domain-containing protein n=1 Tax=Algibacter mikhailovii TaxID=425498 RepID=A0A918R4Z1_9FLAO|nr:T9SS type A sorting domain-containing protein [Algibacter mikhailovii]GGZ86039.1 hypothetical protein GCM10007028_25430 [Algibacter mikhailovii]